MTTRLQAHLAMTLYAVVSDLGRVGIGSADMTPHFRDACDQWADKMDDDCPSAVIAVNLRDGTSKDVTREASATVARDMAAKGMELPEWVTPMKKADADLLRAMENDGIVQVAQ